MSTRNNTGYIGLFGSSSTQTFFTKHYAAVDIDSLILGYGNSYGTSSGSQGDGPGALSVSCSVLLGAAIYRGFFLGAHTGTVNPGAVLWSDEIGVFIPAGTFYFIATYVSGNWPTGMTSNTAKGLGQDSTFDPSVTTDSGEGIASPSGNDTTTTGVKSSSYTTTYSPLYILGRTNTPSPKWIIVGDSIVNYSDELPDMGWGIRALNNQWPVQKISMPGETAQQWVADGTAASLVEARQRVLWGGTHFIFAYGRNDLTASRTLAQIQGDWITSWRRAYSQTAVGFQATVTPKVTSTDQYSTLTNQTSDASEAVRLTVNAWLRDGAPMIGTTPQVTGTTGATVARCNVYSATGSLVTAASGPVHLLTGGILEVAYVIESSQNSGKFNITNLRTVADAAMSTGATPKVLTSATANFTSADLGKSVFVTGAGSAGAVLASTITAVTNSTTVTVAISCTTTVTGAALQIGASTYDGTHPDGYWHRQIAAAIQPVTNAASAAYLASGV